MSRSITEEKIYLSFCLKNCVKDNIYKISFILEDLSSKKKEHFESEERKCIEDSLLISFNQKMPCYYYFERIQTLKIQITKNIPINSTYKTKVIERNTVLSSLATSSNSLYERNINSAPNSEILSIKIERENNNSKEINNSLLEYFQAGIKLSCFISMDFSDDKNIPSLLDNKNNYLKLINCINSFISTYTKNHLFYTSIFGAKDNLSDKTTINLSEKEFVGNNINDFIKSFEESINKKQFISDNKIFISSLIKRITTEIFKIYETKIYNVLFIIIRGNIEKNDSKKIIDAIIKSSYLPLTIFIIGVGKNDFSFTKKKFEEKHKYSSKGMEKFRDNLFFISLIDDFSNDIEKLISWCLIELYNQIITFYNLIKFSPKNMQEDNMENINKSFNEYNSICLEYNVDLDSKKVVNKNPNTHESVESKNNELNLNIKQPSLEAKNKENKEELPSKENEGNSAKINFFSNKIYNTPSGSIIDFNKIDKNYNPYKNDIKINNNLGTIDESKDSKNSQKIQNNGETVKNSNYFIVNNYSVIPK